MIFLPADNVAVVIVTKALEQLSEGMKDMVPEVYVTGDSAKSCKILDAIP